jgi:hypothetical protein
MTGGDVHFQSWFGVSSKLLKQSNNNRSLTTRMIITLSPLDSLKLNIGSIHQLERRSSRMGSRNEISQSRCESYYHSVTSHARLRDKEGPTFHGDIESVSDLRNVTFGQSPKMGVDRP